MSETPKKSEKPDNLIINEKGHLVVNLPILKKKVTFCSPNGKHLKQMELIGRKEDITKSEIVVSILSLLSEEPKQTIEDVEKWDEYDLQIAGEALGKFRNRHNPPAEQNPALQPDG